MDSRRILSALDVLVNKAANKLLEHDDYAELCQALHVSKMYYDIDVGENRYINPVTRKLVIAAVTEGDKIILYDEHTETDLKMKYTYYYGDHEYVHAYIEFQKGIKKEDLDLRMYQFMANQIYIIVSRQNIRMMLNYAELFDAQTSIPNRRYLDHMYEALQKNGQAGDYSVAFVNLRNFKYINERVGTVGGDEIIIKFALMLFDLMENNGSVCRLGGDNFVMIVKHGYLAHVIKTLDDVKIKGIKSMPDKEFNLSAWIGISEDTSFSDRLDVRIEHASIACTMGKKRLKTIVNYYTGELAKLFIYDREITAMFRPAVANHEFTPFFQPKVNMLTGELIGAEALCRWIHDGKFIYPDQFIPILDRQGLIHDLDMTILNETCIAIKKWKEMGLEPPRISVNLSRKNLFIPDIENKIISVIKSHGLSTDCLEIEITETAKESEFNRLIEFLAKLKKNGLRISIDDFGTGYSSLSLIHNINADIVKIDKSFVSSVLSDKKAVILIETIINIAQRLDMDIIAEGIETVEEGKALIGLGCVNAQGYLYSKPVDFEATTEIIRNHGYKPLQ